MMNNAKELVLERIGSLAAIKKLAGIVLFTTLMIFSAHIAVPLPFTPVPLTLQTLFVVLSGAFLGAGAGSVSQLSYLALGAAGLPVFAGGSFGITRFSGPTGGYLWGFVAASWFLGYFFKKADVSWIKLFWGFFLANTILYSLGMLQLSLLLKLSFQKALMMGLFPFIPGEIFKIILAALIYKGYKKFLR